MDRGRLPNPNIIMETIVGSFMNGLVHTKTLHSYFDEIQVWLRVGIVDAKLRIMWYSRSKLVHLMIFLSFRTARILQPRQMPSEVGN